MVVFEQVVLGHPGLRLLVYLTCVRLEDDALSRSEAGDIDKPVILGGQLLQEIVLVSSRLGVDVALGASQGSEVLLNIGDLRLGLE